MSTVNVTITGNQDRGYAWGDGCIRRGMFDSPQAALADYLAETAQLREGHRP